MWDILKSYLTTITSPEMIDILTEALDVFDKINYEGYEDSYNEIIMLKDDTSFVGHMDKILSITMDIQKDILIQHDIVLTDEASIAINTIFINGILGIQDYSDHEAIAKTLVLPLDNAEIFAELVALVQSKQVEDLLPYIDSVSSELIEAVKLMIEGANNDMNKPAHLITHQYVEAINKFCKIIATADLDAIKLIQDGMGLGLPFKAYVKEIGRDLETKKIDSISHELIAMALMSKDGFNNPISIIKENIDSFIADLNTVTAVTIKVTDLLMAFNSYKPDTIPMKEA